MLLMVEAESEVVLLHSFVFASALHFDGACGGATLCWLVLVCSKRVICH